MMEGHVEVPLAGGHVTLAPTLGAAMALNRRHENFGTLLAKLEAYDLAAAADDLVARPEVEGDRVSVVGFCMGGGLALLAPTVSDRIRCATAFYPAMPWPQYAPDWARYAGKAALVHKAASDEPGTGPAIAQYAAAIDAAGGSVELCDYPDSVHAFFNDARPEVFQADNARLAWERTLAFLRACA